MYIYFLSLFIIIIPLFLVLCQWHVCGELVKKMYKFSKIVLPSIELAVSWSRCEHLTSSFSSGNSRWMPFHCIIFKAMFTIYFRLRGLHSPILLFTPASIPILVHAAQKCCTELTRYVKLYFRDQLRRYWNGAEITAFIFMWTDWYDFRAGARAIRCSVNTALVPLVSHVKSRLVFFCLYETSPLLQH